MRSIKRCFIKAKDAVKVYYSLPESLSQALVDKLSIIKKHSMEKVEAENFQIYVIDGAPLILKMDEKFFPTLIFEGGLAKLPKVVVDQAAIPYICRGADVMRPGIVKIVGDFQSNSVVAIVDEKYNKPFAVGLSLYSMEEIMRMSSGKVIKNIHYVGDKVWCTIQNIKT